MTLAIIMIIASYLIGSISSAILVCKCFGLADPRTVGSKNPGTTNVLRHGGRLPAALTLLGDILKGFLPVLVAKLIGLSPLIVAITALAAFMGHLFPIFFKFKGGKGVATTFGIVYALNLWLGLLATATWLLMALVFRYSSLAALTMVATLPAFVYVLGLNEFLIPITILVIIVLVMHHQNIRNLLQGKEDKIGRKK